MLTFLDYLNLARIWCLTLRKEHTRWARARTLDASEPLVFYGHDNIKGPENKVFGGFVKFHDLSRKFPNSKDAANILYLVSSAMPYFSGRMAKMAKAAGAKVIFNQNGVAYPGWHGSGWQRSNREMRRIHELADHVIYQSEFCRNSADHFIGRICDSQEILYNPVDTSVFTPAQGTDRPGEPTILLSGSHWSFYRPEVAIKAIKHVLKDIRNVKLIIAGRFCWEKSEQKAVDQVRECARREGVADNVSFFGTYSQNQAIDLFRNATLLLHTKYNDPCPRLVVEAMSCGLPVVYSATGGVGELVGKNAGVGVEGPLDWQKDHPPSPKLLAEAIKKVMFSHDHYSAEARLRAVRNFDVMPWLTRHKEIFRSIISGVNT